MRWFYVRLTVGALAAIAAAPLTLRAQGFSVNEHGTCAMGRAGTAVASPCADGSTLFFNPAGLAQTEKGHGVIAVGATFIAPTGGFTNDAGPQSELNKKVYPIPTLYLTRGLTDRIAAGLGVFAPYGLTTDWPTASEGRFLGYKSQIRAIYVQPTVAAKFGVLSVGAGFDVNFVHLQLRQRVDLSQQPNPQTPGFTFEQAGILKGTDFADVNLTANGTGVGYHVGVLIQPTDRISFGARYLARQKVTINNGTAEISQITTNIILGGVLLDGALAPQFSGSGPLTNQSASTALRMPEQLVFGVAAKPVDRLLALFDITLHHWSVFDTLAISFSGLGTVALAENFKNTTTYRFGVQYEYSPSTSFRLGYLSHNAAEPPGSVTPNLPEGNRSEFTGGIGTRLGQRLHVDVAYQYTNQGDRRGRTVPFGSPDNGLFKFKANLFGVTFAYAY